MKCPYCGCDDDRVLDTRVQKDDSIRRRRECLKCKARFSTLEKLVVNFPFIVKKDGRREAFEKEKILKGLQAATQKRPISHDKLEAIVEKISTSILSRSEAEISSQIIGQKVMSELKKLDDVAYIRFASVYRSFKDVQEFVDTLEVDHIDHQNDQLENQENINKMNPTNFTT